MSRTYSHTPHTNSPRFLTSLAGVLGCLAIASMAGATVILVDHAGGGDHLTISEGVAAASEGDTVLVAPGTYSGPLNRDIEADYLTIASEGGPHVTIIDCEFAGFAFETYRSSLRGLTIRNGVRWPYTFYGVVYLKRGDITECVFESCVQIGLVVSGNSTVTDCVFRGNEEYGAELSSIDNKVMTGCLFEDNAKGLAVFDLWDRSLDARSRDQYTVRDCVFTGNGDPAVWTYCVGPLFEDCVFFGNHGTIFDITTAYYSIIRHCTIVDNDTEGNSVFHFGTTGYFPNDCSVENNIIAFNECSGLVDGDLENSEFLNNCSFNPDAGADTLPGGVVPPGNIREDPLFCNVTGGDYTLCEDSPCLFKNEPLLVTMGAYCDEPGCDPCNSPVESTSWGAIKALYLDPSQH
jgi:hypothetical protein